MSWKITPSWAPADADAAAYITAVEAADTAAGQSGGLEQGVKIAIDNFVLGCKADGIWSAIKASCILAGARTLQGALVPLVGAAPTSVNFVAGDYNRETGLVGNGSTKYLDSGRPNSSDPQDSQHLAAYVSTSASSPVVNGALIGDVTGASGYSYLYTTTELSVNPNRLWAASRSSAEYNVAARSTGLSGLSRAASSSFAYRVGGIIGTQTQASQASSSANIHVFRLNRASGNFLYSNARIAFYSIGESLNLALLDARVTDLINAIAVAIP